MHTVRPVILLCVAKNKKKEKKKKKKKESEKENGETFVMIRFGFT